MGRRDEQVLQGASAGQIERAQSLIFRGKAGAVRGDPELQRIVNALANLGFQSGRSQLIQAQAREREAQRKAEEQRLQQSIPRKPITPISQPKLKIIPKPKPKKFIGPTRPFTPIPKRVITPIPKPKPVKITTKIITSLSKRQKRLIEVERKTEIKKREAFKVPKRIISLKSEVRALKSFARKVQILGLTTGKVVIQNLRAFKQAPEDVLTITKEIKKDPSKIKKLVKDLPEVLKEEGKAGLKLFRTSPTEAVAIIGGNVLLFAGTGKILKLVGKVSKGPAKKIKKLLVKKKGTPLKFVGTQTQKGNQIITKVIFQTKGKQVGGAVGVSTIKDGKILTQTVGKVGKIKIKKVAGKPKVKKFKVKGVFAGREISVARRKRLKIRKRVTGITVTRNIEGIAQVGLGRVAVARGEKLLRTVVKFPTATLKKKKVKSLKVKDFVSISGILTRKDLSLIVGKTLTKKKDVTDFIGLIKGISRKDISSFSSKRQKLFKQALQDVAGTISASTTKGKRIIPKLSPKGKSAILKRVSGKITKGKVFVGIKAIQKVKVRLRVKVTSKVKQKALLKLQSKLKTLQKQRKILMEKSKLSTAQKLRLLTIQKQITQSKSKGFFVPRIAIPKPKIPVVLIKKRKVRRKPARKLKGRQGFNVFGKSRGKFIRLNKVPLSRAQALDRGAFAVDKSTSARFVIRSTGRVKKLGKVTKAEKGHFSKTRKKFRGVKIRKGKRIGLRNEFIEKRGRPRIDTRGEKKGLSLAKFSKQRGFVGRRKPVKKTKRIKKSKSVRRRSRK